MNVSHCPLRGPCPTPVDVAGYFKGFFSRLITLYQPVLSQRGRKWVNLPAMAPHNLVNIEEKGLPPTMDRQWLEKIGREAIGSHLITFHSTMTMTAHEKLVSGRILHQLGFDDFGRFLEGGCPLT